MFGFLFFFSFFFHFFFFNDTATTEIYTLSLHDALPISQSSTYGNFDVTRANDGRFDVIGQNGITHTQEKTDEWLKIDLKAYIYLAQMIIYNRDGECSGTSCGEIGRAHV